MPYSYYSGGGMNYVEASNVINTLAKQPYVGGYYYNPGYYYGGGAGGAGSAAPAPAPAPAAAPAVTAATVSDLQVLIASIPIAQDGQVISAEYHNGLRAALIAMANRLGLGTISEEITVTNAPQLLGLAGASEWEPDIGVVRKPTTGPGNTGNLRGWMEFDLPDGARIKKMQVFAATDSGNGTMRAKLLRQSITNASASDDLIAIDVADNDATAAKEGDVTLPGSTLGAAAIEETRFVDNRKYKYLFVAELDAGVTAKNARIAAIKVLLGK
jgi:hypothetical protein